MQVNLACGRGRYSRRDGAVQGANRQLKAENERLRGLLEEALRASKRRAALFSRYKPKTQPQKPGRKIAQKYGRCCRCPGASRGSGRRTAARAVSGCPAMWRWGGGLEEWGIQVLLQQALRLRDRHQQEQIIDRGVAVNRGRLEAR